MALYETDLRKQCSKCKKIKDKSILNFELKGSKYSRVCLLCSPKRVKSFVNHWMDKWEKERDL